jgi:hypothetical protein
VVVSEVLEALDLDCAGDVANGVVAVQVIAHFQHDQVLVIDVFGQPVGVNQEIRPRVGCGP